MLDFENFCGGTKYLTDQLRYAGLIANDDPETIDPRYHQVKVKAWQEAGTLVEIDYNPSREAID